MVILLKMALLNFFFAFLDDLGNFKQKKISGIFKSTTTSRTFECTTNSRTAEVQAHNEIDNRFT